MKGFLIFCLMAVVLTAAAWTFGAVPPKNEPRLSLLVHDDWQQRPQEKRLVGWFQADSELSQLRCELYTESSWECKDSLCGVSETLPCVLLQRSDGWVAFKVSGENIPDTAEQLRAGLFGKGKRPIYLLPWRRPKPAPSPTPDVPIDTEEPDTGQDVQDVPQVADTVPEEAPEVAAAPEAEFPSGLAAIVAALSVAATGVVSFTKRVGSFD